MATASADRRQRFHPRITRTQPIQFISDISGGGQHFACAIVCGVFTVQDFQQDMHLDVYGADLGVVEQ